MLTVTYGSTVHVMKVFQNIDNELRCKPDLEDFWNIECIGIKDKIRQSDNDFAREKFKESPIFENGMYQVTKPWKTDNPELPTNRELTFGRLRSVLKRMKDKPELLERYDVVIQDQLTKGIIGEVDNSSSDEIKHYIPHHAVITPKKTKTKIRVVYDASVKSTKDSKSLNVCLYRGPVMLHDLCGRRMRFRLHKTVLVSDIEKAFCKLDYNPVKEMSQDSCGTKTKVPCLWLLITFKIIMYVSES